MFASGCRGPFRPFEWKLKHREDQPHKIRLYYAFRRLGTNPLPDFSGEGVVELVDAEGGWKVVDFDVIW